TKITSATLAPVITVSRYGRDTYDTMSLSKKMVCNASDISGAYNVLVVPTSSSYTAPIIPTIADLPTATLSGMVILPYKFSVSVNYDNPDWGAGAAKVQYATAKVSAFVNDYNTTGTKNVTIQ